MKLQLTHQQHTEEEQQLTVTLEPVKGQSLTLKNKAGRRKPNPFNAMTKAEQRVAIAKDVIKQLDAKKFTATRGTYFLGYGVEEQHIVSTEFVKDLEQNKATTCEVCAIGSSIVSGIRLSGKGRYNNCNYSALSYVGRWFPLKQAQAMEDCFEGAGFVDDDNGSEARLDVVARFVSSLEPGATQEDRLKAVMNNVIANNGSFIP